MKTTFSIFALALGASAGLIPRGDTCYFELTAHGTDVEGTDISGIVGQLSDGQNRIGGDYPTGEYTLSNGGIGDNQGRGCILTPPTTQLQCDVGASPTTGFSIDCHSSVTYKGSPGFYACPAVDSSEFNIYSAPVSGQDKCVPITLTASGCYSSCPTSTATPPPASTCPADLPSDYQFPHLIVPVSKSKPDQAGGTAFNGVINSDTSTIFNFDIPSSYSGKQCKLEFLFPVQSQLQTSSYTFSGDGVLDFVELDTVATTSTTYNRAGGGKDQGQYTITPGSATTIVTAECPAGQAVSFEVKAVSGTSFTFFQDYNPCPIGLYVVPFN